MPKMIIHAPAGAFSETARQRVASELTDFALECEALPRSPFVKSTVWIYFNSYALDAVFMGERPASLPIVSLQIFVVEGGLDASAKTKLVKGATEILGRHLGIDERPPVYIVIQEIVAANWGFFGRTPDLNALRASSMAAPSL